MSSSAAPSTDSLAATLALATGAALVAGLFAQVWSPAVFLDNGLLVPSGPDAFYHARRILDAVGAPATVFQFDARIHAPEGSWVPWPWGFDALLAAIVSALGGAGFEPMRALMWIPPAWLLCNALLLLLACRELGLSMPARAVVAGCFAFSPLTQALHAVGMVDHHFLEYTCVLATLWLGVRSLAAPERLQPAAWLGLVLGLANAIHNGLFLLQVPVLGALTLLWYRRCGFGAHASAAFAAGLVGGTVLAAWPSEALTAGFVDYGLLSWFHVYVACLSALWVGLLALVAPSPAALARCVLLAAMASLPLLQQLRDGLQFLSADLYRGWEASEMRAPLAGLLSLDVRVLRADLQLFSGLLLLLPLSVAVAIVSVVRSHDRTLVFACIFCVFGGLLLMQQARFHHFGSTALYLLPLLLLERGGFARRWRELATPAILAGVALLAHAWSLPVLMRSPPPGGYRDFVVTRALQPTLAEACANRPGIVLAHHLDGHAVRLLTNCAVIANVLVLSPLSFEKLREAQALFMLEPGALARKAPWVRYVLVRREDDFSRPQAPDEVVRSNSPLRQHLLFTNDWPAEYRLLGEVRLGVPGPLGVAARLFEIAPPATNGGAS